jgi:hypothetical protein
LADDSGNGSGFTLTIPTLLIPKKVGDLFLDVWHNREALVLQVKIDVSAKAGAMVEYSVWYGSVLDLTVD